MATDMMRANIARGLIGGVFTLVAAGVSFVLANRYSNNDTDHCDHPEHHVEQQADQRPHRPYGPGGRKRGPHWRNQAGKTSGADRTAQAKPAAHAEPESKLQTSSSTPPPNSAWTVPKPDDPAIDPRSNIRMHPKVQPIRSSPPPLLEIEKRPAQSMEFFERSAKDHKHR